MPSEQFKEADINLKPLPEGGYSVTIKIANAGIQSQYCATKTAIIGFMQKVL